MKYLFILFLIFASCESEFTADNPEAIEPVILLIQETQTETIPNNNYLGGAGGYKLYHIQRVNGNGSLLEVQSNKVRNLNSVWTFTTLSQVKNTTIEKRFVDGILESEKIILEEFVMSGNYSYFQTVFTNRQVKYQKRYGTQTLQYHIDTDGNEWFLND